MPVSSRRWLAIGSSVLLLTLMLVPFTVKPTTQPQRLTSQQMQLDRANYINKGLFFEPNVGQADPQVLYLAHGAGYSVFLTKREVVLALTTAGASNNAELPAKLAATNTQTSVLRFSLSGANLQPQLSAEEEQAGKSNYFIGNDPSHWHTQIPHFGRIVYHDAYPGIDLVWYSSSAGKLEYDFIVRQGADPGLVHLKVAGATSLTLAAGDLLINTTAGELRQPAPFIYQTTGQGATIVRGSYQVIGADEVGFSLAAYDRSRELTIDPTLDYSTYLGGSGNDLAFSVAVDSSGASYIIGHTDGTDFPTAGNPYQPHYAGGNDDAFVSKFAPDGQSLIYSTYLGGSGNDYGRGIAVDSSGATYVTGFTDSTDFPQHNPFQPAYGGGVYDVFVTKLNSDGSGLVYSSYLGGSGTDVVDQGNPIAVDSSGNAYLTGFTTSTDFPTHNPYQPNNAGAADAFVTVVNAGGSGYIYSTYLGGSGNDDQGRAIAVDSTSHAYVVGVTNSTNFPTHNPIQPNNAGGDHDAFVTEFTPTGTSLVYSTYLGGTADESSHAIAVDGNGNAYVTGSTFSTNFPTHNPLQASYGGGTFLGDGFVTAINAGGSAYIYSTYLGGSSDDEGRGIAADSGGNVYIDGDTSSTDFPTMNPIQLHNAGSYDGFAAQISASGAALLYSTYLGGSGADYLYGLGLDAAGSAYLVGHTTSTDFPTHNPYQQHNAGQYDAILAKIANTGFTPTPTPPATATPSPSATPTTTPTSTATAISTASPTQTDTPTTLPTTTPTLVPSSTSTPVPSSTPSPSPTDCPNVFVDINGNIFYTAIHYLNCRGVVNGTDATHYSPAETSTRGQFAKVVVLGFGLSSYTPATPDFSDVPPGYFAYLYIESGFHAGILSGFDPASCQAAGQPYPCYLPNRPITRGQLTKLVVNAAGYPLYTPIGGQDFTDVPPNNVFYVSIETAHNKGVINGYPDGTFRPSNNIRRDEMAQIVYKGVTTP